TLLPILDLDASARFLDQSINNIQTETSPFAPPFQLASAAIKNLEDLLPVVGRNPGTIITDLNEDVTAPVRFYSDLHFRRITTVLDGIIEQVRKNEIEHNLLGANGDWFCLKSEDVIKFDFPIQTRDLGKLMEQRRNLDINRLFVISQCV